MSGYAYQEESVPNYQTTKREGIHSLTAREASILLQMKEQCAADMLIRAAAEGWELTLPRAGEDQLVVGYDDLVPQMNQALQSENPAHIAYGQLLARSLRIDLVPDGK